MKILNKFVLTKRGKSKDIIISVSLLLSLGLITYLAYLGELGEAYLEFYFIPITLAAWYFGISGGLISGAFSSVLSLTLFASSEPLLNAPNWFLHLFFFCLVGLQVGLLSEFLRAEKNKYENQSLELLKARGELELKISQLDALRKIDSAILDSRSSEKVLDLVTGLALNAVRAKGCAIVLKEQEDDCLTFKSYQGLSKRFLRRMSKLKLREGEGAEGWVVLSGKPVAISNVTSDPRLERFLEALREERISSIISAPLILSKEPVGALSAYFSKLREFDSGEVALFKNFTSQIAVALQHAELIEKLRNLSIDTIRSLALAIDARDPYTAGHSETVSKYAVAVAKKLKLGSRRIKTIEYASLLHDIGKIGIREEILKKPGKLNADEKAAMKLHPFLSSRIIRPIKFLEETVPIIYHHHESYGGSGYPDGLKGKDIPLGARIITVADAFEAMTSDRPYRGALSRNDAISELKKGVGVEFDKKVVEAFLDVLEKEEVRKDKNVSEIASRDLRLVSYEKKY